MKAVQFTFHGSLVTVPFGKDGPETASGELRALLSRFPDAKAAAKRLGGEVVSGAATSTAETSTPEAPPATPTPADAGNEAP